MRAFVPSPQIPKALPLLAFNGPWSLILQSAHYPLYGVSVFSLSEEI